MDTGSTDSIESADLAGETLAGDTGADSENISDEENSENISGTAGEERTAVGSTISISLDADEADNDAAAVISDAAAGTSNAADSDAAVSSDAANSNVAAAIADEADDELTDSGTGDSAEEEEDIDESEKAIASIDWSTTIWANTSYMSADENGNFSITDYLDYIQLYYHVNYTDGTGTEGYVLTGSENDTLTTSVEYVICEYEETDWESTDGNTFCGIQCDVASVSYAAKVTLANGDSVTTGKLIYFEVHRGGSESYQVSFSAEDLNHVLVGGTEEGIVYLNIFTFAEDGSGYSGQTVSSSDYSIQVVSEDTSIATVDAVYLDSETGEWKFALMGVSEGDVTIDLYVYDSAGEELLAQSNLWAKVVSEYTYYEIRVNGESIDESTGGARFAVGLGEDFNVMEDANPELYFIQVSSDGTETATLVDKDTYYFQIYGPAYIWGDVDEENGIYYDRQSKYAVGINVYAWDVETGRYLANVYLMMEGLNYVYSVDTEKDLLIGGDVVTDTLYPLYYSVGSTTYTEDEISLPEGCTVEWAVSFSDELLDGDENTEEALSGISWTVSEDGMSLTLSIPDAENDALYGDILISATIYYNGNQIGYYEYSHHVVTTNYQYTTTYEEGGTIDLIALMTELNSDIEVASFEYPEGDSISLDDTVATIIGTGSSIMNVYGPYWEDGSGYRDYFGKLAITVAQAEGTISGEKTWSVTYKKGSTFDLGLTTNHDADATLSYRVTEGSDVISVDEAGIVTILGTGTATITATLEETSNYTGATMEITVTVKAADTTPVSPSTPEETETESETESECETETEPMEGLALNEADGIWYYYTDGEVDTTFKGIAEYEGGQFFVANGILCSDAQGLNLYDDEWYFLANGQVQTQYTGLALYDDEWFYITEGVLDTSVNGLVPYDGEKFIFADGRLLLEYNGLWLNSSGIGGDNQWYFIAVGQVQNVSQVVMYDGEWFVVENGILDTSYNGTIVYDGATFMVVNGQLY